MNHKERVAVLFGGRSPEHDVSILTGLQALHAIDNIRYDAFPVYVDMCGQWWTGDLLREKSIFLPTVEYKDSLESVLLDLKVSQKGVLHFLKKRLFKKTMSIYFDLALLAFHGLSGENGDIQGTLELANIPYTGVRVMASSIFMDKFLTKEMLNLKGVPSLPHLLIKKPKEGLLLLPETLQKICNNLKFPCCIKPRYLGSSIGVEKVKTPDELNAALPNIFQYDSYAIVEPFVENLVEYNVSVRKGLKNDIVLSAIERPKYRKDLLDFKQKYCSYMNLKSGFKSPSIQNFEMLSLTRDISPKLDQKIIKLITNYSKITFSFMESTGVPRIDFIGNKKTGEIWLNEVNPCPGSFGYYLWEKASDPLIFTELLTHLLKEAVTQKKLRSLSSNNVPAVAHLFYR